MSEPGPQIFNSFRFKIANFALSGAILTLKQQYKQSTFNKF